MKPFDSSLAHSSYCCGSESKAHIVVLHFLFYFTQITMKATKQVKSQSLFLLKTWSMFLVQLQLCR